MKPRSMGQLERLSSYCRLRYAEVRIYPRGAARRYYRWWRLVGDRIELLIAEMADRLGSNRE